MADKIPEGGLGHGQDLGKGRRFYKASFSKLSQIMSLLIAASHTLFTSYISLIVCITMT